MKMPEKTNPCDKRMQASHLDEDQETFGFKLPASPKPRLTSTTTAIGIAKLV
jgi:hypothetical protein